MCAGAGLVEMINYKELYLTGGWRSEQGIGCCVESMVTQAVTGTHKR